MYFIMPNIYKCMIIHFISNLFNKEFTCFSRLRANIWQNISLNCHKITSTPQFPMFQAAQYMVGKARHGKRNSVASRSCFCTCGKILASKLFNNVHVYSMCVFWV